MKRIYLDNAATTPLLPEVLEAMQKSMAEHWGNPSSIHYFGRISKAAIESSRKTVAQLLNCSIGEIYFFSSATEANNLIIDQCVKTLDVKRIITSKMEHPCVSKAIDKVEENCAIEFLSVDCDGRIDLDQLEKLLKEGSEKTLVSLMYVNNEIGSILNIEKVAQLCKEHGALLHSDAVQAIGKIPIDLNELRLNFLSASAHKFHGPKGIGFAYINGENNIDPAILGGAQERNMRAGTENIIGIVGMTTALDLAYAECDARKEKTLALKLQLMEGLLEIDRDIKFNGSPEDTLSNILSVSFPASENSEMLTFNLDINGICASAGSACSSGVEHASPVLQAIDHDLKRKAIRFSFSHLNTEEEINYTLEKIKSFL